MKSFFTLILAAGVGAVAAGVVAWAILNISHKKSLVNKQDQHDTVLANLKQEYEKELMAVPSRKSRPKAGEPASIPGQQQPTNTADAQPDDSVEEKEYTPESLLKYLKKTEPSGDNVVGKKRRIIHCFVGLVEFGDEALPAIDEFLQGEPVKGTDEHSRLDRAYDSSSRKDPREQFNLEGKEEDKKDWRAAVDYWGGMAFRRGGELFPQSLRIGLFEVVWEIGGLEAEGILLRELAETGRGIEVVILGDLLEKLSPGKHKEAVLKSAHELIEKPLDDDSRRILFALLFKHKDERLIEFAQKILVNSEGRIEGAALRYINETLGERAMPILYKLYKNPDITSPGDKFVISDAAMTYVGKNADADNIFREVFDDGLKNAENPESNPREAYGKLFIAGGSLLKGNPTPQVIRNRQKLLGEYLGRTQNPLVKRGLEQVNQELANKLKAVEEIK